MRTNLIIGLLAILIVALGCTTTEQALMQKDAMVKEDTMEKNNDNAMVKDEAMVKNDTMQKQDAMSSDFMAKGNKLGGTTTPYIEFNKEDYDKAIAEDKTIVLYFYASWCPICKAEQQDTLAAFNDLGLDDVVGFRVDYKDGNDDEFEKYLAREHGITYQHTKVILKDGQRVLKNGESWDKQRYIEEITKVA